jgi:hypothetical protein
MAEHLPVWSMVQGIIGLYLAGLPAEAVGSEASVRVSRLAACQRAFEISSTREE